MLISGLDFSRYSPRIYIVSDGDMLSTSKALSLERSKAPRSSAIRVSSYYPFYLCRCPHDFVFRDLMAGGTTGSWRFLVLGACTSPYGPFFLHLCIPSWLAYI